MSGDIGVGSLVDGKYRIMRLIGEGGWGMVFEAENARTLKRVALKVLRNQANVTDDIKARFEREAQAAGRIGSEHIVEVFDLGTLSDGSSYMVMELLQGEDLGTRLQAAVKLDQITATKLVVQLLDGLGAAHAAGIMHRDLKPENLFIVPTKNGDEFVKILDFGISKFNIGPAPTSHTMTGAVLGSPCYMAPEQARGLKQIDARTDLYAVGTVLFECVTGRVPFQGDNFNDLMFRIVLAPRPDPRELEPDLDPGLAQIILKAIAADPNDRFATADEFRLALVECLASLGVASVRAPDVRRTVRTPLKTPRDAARSGAPSAASATPKNKPHWSDATMPVESGALGAVPADGTPIASARTIQAPGNARRKKILMAAAIGALALVGVGVALTRGHAQATTVTMPPVGETAPAPPVPATVAPDIAPAQATPDPATTPPLPAASAPAAATPQTDPSAVAAAAASAASAARHGRGGRGPATTTRDAGAAAPEAPKPAPATPTPANPTKPTNEVEGREIRTNL